MDELPPEPDAVGQLVFELTVMVLSMLVWLELMIIVTDAVRHYL